MNQPLLKARLYESLASLAGLQPAWEELLSQFPTATTFSSPDWLLPWWRAFGNNQQLKVLGFFDSMERLVGLAPLSIATHHVTGGLKLRLLRMMGDGSNDSDNLDFPVLPGYESAFADGLLDFMKTGSFLWDLCQLNTLPEHSPSGAALIASLERRRWRYFTFQRPWLVVNLPARWEEYLEQLAKGDRHNLEYYTRRLHRRYEVRIYKCTEEHDLANCLETLFSLHQKRWLLRGEPGTFASPGRRGFYHDLSRRLLARNCLEFWLLELNGTAVAAQFGFRYRQTVFSLQEGFDPDRTPDKVGLVLRGHVLKQLSDAGTRQYDFLFGQSPGKDRWLPQLQRYKDIHFARPVSRGSFYLRLSHSALASKEWLRLKLPRHVWNVLRDVKTRVQFPNQKGDSARTR